ncbi:hypothetical protein BDZ89DRAFT_1130978 [Hymenopellis radicata]|nr:hypothetical protein BDZ89DRAFT_1130978 [Hymenopellis radicata]
MTLLVGSPDVHVQTSSSTTEEVKRAICECIHDLVKASKDLAQEPHVRSRKLAVVEAQKKFKESLQGCPRKKWKITRGNHFLDPVFLEPPPSSTLRRDGASKAKRNRFWTPESTLGDNEQSFQTYLNLVAKYRYKPSEGRLKELIAHLENHREDRVPAKEETPEQLWCEMVFRSIRETRNRRLDGMTIGQTRIEQWDVIPVAVKTPCARCAESSLDLECEYTGKPGIRRCRECILSKRTCSLSNSASTAPTRQSERTGSRPATHRGSRRGAFEDDFPDSDDVIVIDSPPKRTVSVSSKRKQNSASTSAPNKRPRATANVKSSSSSRRRRQISADDDEDEDDAIAEMRHALSGLQDQVQDLRTVQQSWKAVRMDAVDKVASFRDEIMDILSRLPA